jgi:4-amino-4-deoxy-L-arabinose transferase-like glycosyltransferase
VTETHKQANIGASVYAALVNVSAPSASARGILAQPIVTRFRSDPAVMAIAAFCALAALVRLPFIWTGISMDEGGYAYVAEEWARGGDLYGSAWLDRPQGLLLTYRFLLALDGSGWTIRLGAIVAGVVITALIGLIGTLLVGRRAGVAAAGLYAVAGLAPQLEGFTLNGELLASVPATAAVACALLWRRSGTRGWLVAAGLMAGAALTMKPSGVDGFTAVLAIVALTPRDRVRAAALFLAGFAAPLAACAVHGLVIGWSQYWTANVGYHLNAMGGSGSNTHTRWAGFAGSAVRVSKDLTLPVVLAIAGLAVAWRTRFVRLVLAVWLLTCAAAVNLGGAYWPHYYLQLLPPAAVAGGIAIAAIRRPPLRAAALVLAVLPTLAWLAALVPMTAAERQATVPYYHRALRDERIAAAVRASTCPGDRIFVLVSEANIYFLADRSSAFPLLWGKPIEKIPGSVDRLRTLFAGPHRPVLVLLNSDPASVDSTGRLQRVLNEHYRHDSTVSGVKFLRSGPAKANC